MKTLILPAEIKSRELDARLLHAVIALNANWRVITGSKALINRNIWRIPRGVYLMQTMTHKRLYMAKLLKKLKFNILGWDEEGLVYLDKELYLSRRISSETLEHVDQVCTWGEQGATDTLQRAKCPVNAIGNPRFDVLRPEVRGIYSKEVEEICTEHGDFILLNTNFSSVNPIISLHDQPARAISDRDKPAGKQISQQYEGFLDHRRQMLAEFWQMLPKLVKAFPDRTIVVRPHPAEDLTTWEKQFANEKTIKIIRTGASIPWLMASKILVHNGCTTAIETRLLGNNPIAYAPVSSDEHESPLPNGISHIATNVSDLIKFIENGLAGTLEQTAEQKQVLDQYVSGCEGPLAAQQAFELGQNFSVETPNPWYRELAIRLFSFGRYVYKSTRRNHRTDRYLKKIFPKTSPDEIETRANLIAKELSLAVEGKISVREISANIFEMRAN